MAADYEQTRHDADDQLREGGAICVLTWTPPPLTDVPNASQPDPVTRYAYGCIFEYAPNRIGTQPDSLIRAGDLQLLLSTLDVDGNDLPEPPADAVITGPDGARYVCKKASPLSPAGVPVIYDICMRR